MKSRVAGTIALVLLASYAVWSNRQIRALQQKVDALSAQLSERASVAPLLPPMAEFRVRRIEGRLDAIEGNLDPRLVRDEVDALLRRPIRDVPMAR